MELRQVELTDCPAYAPQMKKLYQTAFPREERLPWWLLRLNARRKGIGLTAFLDGEDFCGFTASATVEGMHFLLFLAVEDSHRGKGYGSRILKLLKEAHDTVALNVELLEESAPNLAQRKRRLEFYKRNGFFDTGYHVWEVGGEFGVLSTDPVLDTASYKQIFRKLSLGFWDVRLEKMGEMAP